MAPPHTARTFKEDPNFMILYYAITSTTAKPDYEVVATKAGLSTAAAAKKRLERLIKLQTDAENDDDDDAEGPPAATSTAEEIGEGGRKKAKDAEAGKAGGAGKDAGRGEKVKSTAKKRKVADLNDESEVSDDGRKANKGGR